MKRINGAALFFVGASLFCAAGWTSPSFAAWAARISEVPQDFGASQGNTTSALAPSAQPFSHAAPYSNAGNGVPNAASAPQLAPPIGFEPSRMRAREIDHVDPWNGESHQLIAVRQKMQLEGVDPWSPAIAAPARIAHVQLQLDNSDPWSNIR